MPVSRHEKITDFWKIAALFTVAIGISLVLYVMSVFGIFFKTVE
jgi:hypothetical protein